MTTTAHSTLTGTDLHEPKGIVGTTSGQIYVANGGNSGTWTSIYGTNTAYVFGSFVDVSAPDTIYIPVPFTGTASTIYITLKNAITTANSIITVKNNAGTSMAATCTVTFTGSAAGSTYTAALTTNNTFTAGQSIQITTDGGSSTTAIANVAVKFTLTA